MRKGLASTCKWKQWRGRGMRAVASATRVAAVRAQHRRRASAGTGQALPGAGAPPPAAQSIPRRPAKSALSLGNTNLWRVQLKEVLLVPALLLGKLNLAQVVEFPRLESSRPRRGQGNSRPSERDGEGNLAASGHQRESELSAARGGAHILPRILRTDLGCAAAARSAAACLAPSVAIIDGLGEKIVRSDNSSMTFMLRCE